ncbi:DUF1835 domain-containing protein [Clostridioides sp. ZZV14-6154]|uniref:DUF1835 domain-containing protein n=1 Tax=Clostridioides sp. ZZV14-6154 TaxID=2811495 RepID=UPI001D12DF88|nr:DUF1835 domain-containing protein [Clostridioides sp. ZZV14-6154]
MAHICFNDVCCYLLKEAMKLKLIPHNKIVSFEDDLSIGDISDVNNHELRENIFKIRKDFENNPKLLFKANLLEDRKLVKHRDTIIWCANNPKDLCGLYYVVSKLQDKNIKIVLIDEKKTEDGLTKYSFTSEMAPEDFPFFLDKALEISFNEKLEIKNKWDILVKENAALRALVGEEIKSVEETYFDKYILKNISDKCQPLIGVVAECMFEDGMRVKDWFILWRIVELSKLKIIEIKGSKYDFYSDNEIRKI